MPYAQVHYPFENAEWFEAHFPGDFICEYIAAQDQIDQRALFLGDAAQLQRRALVEAQGGIVGERQGGAARPPHPQRVAEAQCLAERRGRPDVRARELQLDRSLQRDDARRRGFAPLLRLARARHQHRQHQRAAGAPRGPWAIILEASNAYVPDRISAALCRASVQ